MIIIYELLDPETLEVRYVGLTTNTLEMRFSQHLRNCGTQTYYSARWIHSLRKKDMLPSVREFYRTDDPDEADSIEISLIAYCKSMGCRLTNHHEGGQANRIVDQGTRDKISRALKGKKQTSEHIAKVAASHRGSKRPPGTGDRIAAGLRGKPLSDSHKRTLSEAHKGRKTPTDLVAKRALSCAKYWDLTCPDGHHFVVRNLKKFCEENGLRNSGMHSVLSGKSTHHKGWKVRRHESDLDSTTKE
jgi:hypothetical protein